MRIDYFLLIYKYIKFTLLPIQLTKCIKNKVKLATLVKGNPKAPFSIATTLRCRGGRYSIPWIALLYPQSLPYSGEC